MLGEIVEFNETIHLFSNPLNKKQKIILQEGLDKMQLQSEIKYLKQMLIKMADQVKIILLMQ